jgi:ferredoxin
MSEATLILNGRRSVVAVQDGESILAAALRTFVQVPYACSKGDCGTCIAELKSGEVKMRRNNVLDADDLEAGYVLTCQAVPVTDSVTIQYL